MQLLMLKAVALYANTDPSDWSQSCLHMKHQLPHPAETSQHNCTTPTQDSVFPTLLSQNPAQNLTLHRGKT